MFDPRTGKIPWRRKWQPNPSPGESHGQRSLASYSPWGCKESDTTGRLTLLLPLSVLKVEIGIINLPSLSSL